MVDKRVWLITGASSGFGSAIAQAALAAGDLVVGAVRRPERLQNLIDAYPDRMMAVKFDVTDTDRAPAIVHQIVEAHPRIDVLVNNAGRTQVGALEETTDQELRALFDLHFFGPAALTRAVLPQLRRQGGGTVVQMSSVGGQVTAAGFGAYSATKFALEGLTETLSQEVDFGVRFILVEPGAFRTNLFAPGAAYESSEMAEYAGTVGPTRDYIRTGGGSQAGDPAKAAMAILTAVDSDTPPLRLALGADAISGIDDRLTRLRAELHEWDSVGRATAFDE